MPDTTIERCTQATGACEGLCVAADGGRVTIGEGYGFCGGERVEGGWALDMARQEGWRFVQVATGGAVASEAQVRGTLPLAVVRVEGGAVVAIRDVRPHLCVWRWLGPVGGMVWAAGAQRIITRVQGAVQVGGLWELARVYAPLAVGNVVEADMIVVSEVRADKTPLAATGLIVETVGIVG